MPMFMVLSYNPILVDMKLRLIEIDKSKMGIVAAAIRKLVNLIHGVFMPR